MLCLPICSKFGGSLEQFSQFVAGLQAGMLLFVCLCGVSWGLFVWVWGWFLFLFWRKVRRFFRDAEGGVFFWVSLRPLLASGVL